MGVINLGILIDKLKRVFVKRDSLEADVSELGFVKNTDYATETVGGVIKASSGASTAIAASGALIGVAKTAVQYASAAGYNFICKGTLENIKTNLLTSAMIDYATNQIVAQANDIYSIRLFYDGNNWSIIAEKTN